MRYRYSKELVYNNFPWPTPTPKQTAAIEKTAQAILDARELYPDSSLADLYDEVLMPKELREAHHQLDLAVERIYRTEPFTSDEERLEHLFKLYAKMTKK